MRGADVTQDALFCYTTLNDMVPSKHLMLTNIRNSTNR